MFIIKEAKLTFGIGANISKGFVGSFSKASETINALNAVTNNLNESQKQNTKTIQKLKKSISSSTSALKPMKNGLDTMSKTIENSKNKMVKLDEKIKKGGRGSKSAAKDYKKLERELARLQNEYNKKLSNYNKINTQLKNEEKQVEKLTSSYKKNAKELVAFEKAKKMYSAGEKSKKIGGSLSSAGTKSATTGAAGVAMLTPAVYTAIKQEAAFADVKKQFDFKDKESEDKFKEELQKIVLDKKLAVSIPELYSAAASAGQSGLNQDEAIKYVEHGIKTGIAFDIGKSDASKSIFMLKNAFNLTFDDLVKLTDIINALGNTTGANAAEITDFVSRVGNVGTVAGFTTGQIAALGATLVEQGMTPEIAATGAKKLMGSMTKGFAASKSQQQAFNMLGLDSEYLAKSAQTDAEGTMLKIFDRLGKLKKDKQGAVITLLFGEEGLRGAAGVLQNQEKLMINLKNSKNKKLYQGSVQQEANVRGETLENKLQVNKSALDIRGAKLGEILFPEIEKLSGEFNNLLDKVAIFQKENPKLFSGIVRGVAYGSVALIGLGAGLKVVGAVASGLSPIFKGIGFLFKSQFGIKAKDIILNLLKATKTFSMGIGTTLKGSLISLGGVFKTVASSVARFGVALLANPVTWYVAAILALIAAGYLIYKNWDMLKEKGIELWNSILTYCAPIVEMWDNIKNKAGTAFDFCVEKVISFKDTLKSALDGVFSWLTEKFEKVIELKDKALNFIGNTWNKGTNFIKENIPGFAEGGFVNSPTLAMVGEGNYSETIIPHNNSPRSIDLWEKTGRLIGAYDKKESLNTNNSIVFNFSPVIHANDLKGVKNEIESQRDISFKEFEKMYDKLQKDRKRRGHGR